MENSVLAMALAEAVTNLIRFSAIWAVLVSLEVVFPREPISMVSRCRSLAFWLLSIPAWAVVATVFHTIWKAIGVEPLLSARIETGVPWLDVVIAILIGNVITDFFFYWRHRAQHTWLWRFHAIHHSIRELSAISSYHHISEELVRIACVALPLSLLFERQETIWVGLTGSFIGFYAHANTRATLGPLRYLFLDPVVHRIHHSVDPRHHGKNFCGFTPLWDVVFGTAYFPKRGEWPSTGLDTLHEPETPLDWLRAPWRLATSARSAPDEQIAPELESGSRVSALSARDLERV